MFAKILDKYLPRSGSRSQRTGHLHLHAVTVHIPEVDPIVNAADSNHNFKSA